MFEFIPRAAQAFAHRSGGDAEQVGNLVCIVTLVIVQVDDFPISQRQRLHGAQQGIVRVGRRGCGDVGSVVEGGVLAPPCAFEQVFAGVDRSTQDVSAFGGG